MQAKFKIGMLIVVAGQLLLSYVTAQDALPVPTVPAASAVGAIEGVVIYESDRARPWRYRRYYVKGRERGPLAEAVVSLAAGSLPKPQPKVTTVPYLIDQKDYHFVPETLAIEVGATIRFANSDPTLHDVTTTAGKEQTSIALYHSQTNERKFSAAGGIDRPVTLSCKFHSEMRGWIFVFDHPWFQVTEPEGRFALRDIPPGKHRLVMVHPAGELRLEQELEVQAGATTRVELVVSPDHVTAKER